MYESTARATRKEPPSHTQLVTSRPGILSVRKRCHKSTPNIIILCDLYWRKDKIRGLYQDKPKTGNAMVKYMTYYYTVQSTEIVSQLHNSIFFFNQQQQPPPPQILNMKYPWPNVNESMYTLSLSHTHARTHIHTPKETIWTFTFTSAIDIHFFWKQN
jgi:hypothetical protein